MNNRNFARSPWKVMCAVASKAWLLSLSVSALAAATSSTVPQFQAAVLTFILLTLASILLGLAVGLRYQEKREAHMATQDNRRIHYPQRAHFDERMRAVDLAVRKFKKA